MSPWQTYDSTAASSDSTQVTTSTSCAIYGGYHYTLQITSSNSMAAHYVQGQVYHRIVHDEWSGGADRIYYFDGIYSDEVARIYGEQKVRVPAPPATTYSDTTDPMAGLSWQSHEEATVTYMIYVHEIFDQLNIDSYEERRAEREKARKEKEMADERAKELLISILDDDQKIEFEKTGAISVKAVGKNFKIRKGWTGNVDELDKSGKKIASYCIHPETRVPEYDNMTSQLLMLLFEPKKFLRVANRSSW